MDESFDQIEGNRRWLVDMRKRLGWSTTETADFARKAAQQVHEDLKLSQQAVSAFEKGKHKATPRWLGYVQMAMQQHLADRHLDDMGLDDLRLPPNMALFFTARQKYDPAVSTGDHALPDVLTTEKRQGFGAFPAQGAEDFASEHGLMPIRQIDLAFGMGATFLDVPVEEQTMLFPAHWVRQYTKAPASKLFFAQGVGDSMQPTLAPNDTLIIDCSQERLTMADQIWAVTYCGLGMIKRLRPTKEGGVRIMSDNPHVPEEIAHDGELQLVGRVVAVMRKV